MPTEYTPGEVSKMLDIPPSSLRRYVEKFGEQMSPSARRRRGRMFSDRDLALIAKIRDLTGQGVALEKIAPQLADVVDQTPPEELPPQTALAIFQRISENMTDIAGQVKDQRQELEELRARMDALAAALESERNTPWYKRIFKRKE